MQMSSSRKTQISLFISRDRTLVWGDLTVNRLNTSTGIKFRAFCLFVTTGYPFSLEGGILNVESNLLPGSKLKNHT